MPDKDLRLLALDGGGVRGLSTLIILGQLMDMVNPDSPPKPCDYFDMIGGTSTGGLIAVMLGRLKMNINECIDAYLLLSDRIFQKKRHRVTIKGTIQGRFDSEELARAVKEVVIRKGLQEDVLLKDASNETCKVFVCATSTHTSETVRLTSYQTPRGFSDLLNNVKIWEACRATSAASSFFDPITIGRYEEEFVDGATGANNPVWEVWNEAQQMWGPEPLESRIKCLVSIGTGVPSLKPFQDNILHIGKTLLAIATETEQTAEKFQRDKLHLDNTGRYYRFNVAHGLENIGLEESKQRKEIAAATRRYIQAQEVFKQMQACAGDVGAREYVCTNNSKRPMGVIETPVPTFAKSCLKTIAIITPVCTAIRHKDLHKKSKHVQRLLADLQTIETILTYLVTYLRARGDQERATRELQETAKRTLEEHVNKCKGLIKNLDGKVNSYEGRKYQLNDIETLRGNLCESRRSLVKALGATELLEKERTIRQAGSTHSPQELSSSEMQDSSLLGIPEDKLPKYIQAQVREELASNMNRFYDELLIVANSSMAMSSSANGKKHNIDFIRSWLHRLSNLGALDQDRIDNGPRIAAPNIDHETAKVVPASLSEADGLELSRMSNVEFEKEGFPFGNFAGHFVVNVSSPRFLWSKFGNNGEVYSQEPRNTTNEFTVRRYTAVTSTPESFTLAGFRLRQQILPRDIERFLAVKITEDLSSQQLAEKIEKVTRDVRELISRSGDDESWTQIVIGFFCHEKIKSPFPKFAAEGSVLTKMGILAEFPVDIKSDNSVNTIIFGRQCPSSVGFKREGSEQNTSQQNQLPEMRPVLAHLHEFTTSLAPVFQTEVSYQIENCKIPLQYIVCFGSNIDRWIEALWRAMDARCCFSREEEGETGAYNYKLLYKEM